MRIPFWQRDQAHPTKAIDRLQSQRTTRQVIGISIDEEWSRVAAALVEVRGGGKFARFREVQTAEVELEPTARTLLLEMVQATDSDSGDRLTEADLQFAGSELAAYQANCCRLLLSRAHVAASEVVAVGITDPGVWMTDFEGRMGYRSLSNAMELASRTSITVIDRFPERDVLDGGTGRHLFALGYWFWLGDRNPRVAEENRVLVLDIPEGLTAYYLPASDGLDATLPGIELIEIACPDQTDRLLSLERLWSRLRDREPDATLRVIAESDVFDRQGCETEGLVFSTLEEFGIRELAASSTAFLANAFVDQFPVSLPEISRNPTPRVLGSLTPGSLVNFRNYVQQASKVSPAIMKLRDAV